MSLSEKFMNFVEKRPVTSRVMAIGATAAVFIAASQGGKNVPVLDDVYTQAKDQICDVMHLDCSTAEK